MFVDETFSETKKNDLLTCFNKITTFFQIVPHYIIGAFKINIFAMLCLIETLEF